MISFGLLSAFSTWHRGPLLTLPNVDFSRDILAQQVKRLLVLRDSRSGWCDLQPSSPVSKS
jgi:hypothetical protein